MDEDIGTEVLRMLELERRYSMSWTGGLVTVILINVKNKALLVERLNRRFRSVLGHFMFKI